MEYFFDDREKQKELKEILDSWINPPTPFRHQCGVKNLGCDCAYFVARVFEEIGILRWRKNLMPDYPRDWHLHNTRELLKETIEKEFRCESIELEFFLNGDMVLFHYGKAASHIGIFFDGYFYQALEMVGVCRASAHEKGLRKRMRFAYRILR
ncbi:MAG: NlpC/P60 family protein [Desulfobacterales bacterium]|nr:NlpC/P60 family protein [Desulfobacterales bacterium]